MPGTLVCFAVKEEAGPFRLWVGARTDIEIAITGMGRRNAERSLRDILSRGRPDRVFTCGFAGGLNPELVGGDVVFAGAEEAALHQQLIEAGARPAQFHCADRVAVTAAEKHALRSRTGADAVEMESGFIHTLCAEHAISAVTIRAISDAAHEDLPVDFNALMTPDDRIPLGRLLGTVLRSPGLIPGLLRLQRRTRAAAIRLAETLAALRLPLEL